MNKKEKFIMFFKKKIWYMFLLSLSSIYVFYYRFDIYQLKELNVQNLIFLLWIILLIFPLFSEVELFGIKMKKELVKSKEEVKEKINELQMLIADLKISNSNANTINVGNSYLPTEQKLKELIEEFISNSSKKDDRNDINSTPIKIDNSPQKGTFDNIEFNTPNESIYLFKVRLMLEKTLSDLCEKTNYGGHKSMSHMIRHLIRCEIINVKTGDLLNQIVKIANRGVHGEIVSKEYIDFVQKVLPELQKQLNEISSNYHYFICPRCKSNVYSRYNNFCPICGFINDDF